MIVLNNKIINMTWFKLHINNFIILCYIFFEIYPGSETVPQIATTLPQVKATGIHTKDVQPNKVIAVPASTSISGNKVKTVQD